VSVIDGGAAIGDFDVAPAFERGKHHEQISRAVALVFVIAALPLSWLHWDRRSRVREQLLGSLVQTDERNIKIAWPLGDGQHVLHRRYERAVRLRRDDPLLFEMRLELVFFRTRPIVLSLA
jgi:hypothetical protein